MNQNSFGGERTP